MRLTINGEQKDIEPALNPLNLAILIEQLGHHPRLIVVEFNGTILNPQNWKQQKVQDGDSLEIVTIVGGGSYSQVNRQSINWPNCFISGKFHPSSAG